MSFSAWLLAGAILIIILTIALGIGWWIRNNNSPALPPPTKYSPPAVWGAPTLGPNPAKNFCQLYEFPTAVVDIDGIPTAVPGTPSFNSAILDNITGTPHYPLCLDSDQIMAQQLQHGCTAPAGVINNAIPRCYLINGGVTGVGGTETYYTNNGCFKIPPCVGQLSLVSINFQAPTNPNIFCIQNQGMGATALMESCNPANPAQLFRVTRVNPGQNPNSLQPGQGQNGIIAQILDRNTGLCLVPGTGTTSTIFDPSYLDDPGCTGTPQIISGTNVTLGACTGGQFPGYVWLLLPSSPYCPNTGGCSGCSGCVGCTRVSGTDTCSGCAGCTGNAALPTPPQIIYIGNINIANIPIGVTGYHGLTGISAIIQYLLDNNTQALYYGGTGTGLILTPMGTDVTVCAERPYTAQYLNITTYNTLINEEVCLQEGNPNTSCTNL